MISDLRSEFAFREFGLKVGLQPLSELRTPIFLGCTVAVGSAGALARNLQPPFNLEPRPTLTSDTSTSDLL